MLLTIAIATWNRSALLAETLASLAKLRVPPGVAWDVLVCDNNSSDDTRAVVEQAAQLRELSAQPGFGRLTYLFEGAQGKSHALNRMVREAKGDWLLFLDDDVVVDPDWLAAYVEAIRAHPKAAVFGGAILPRLYHEPSRKQRHLLSQYPAAWGVLEIDNDSLISNPDFTPGGANMAVRRDFAQRIGFDPNRGMIAGTRIAGEDAMMAWTIVGEGNEGWMLAAPKVFHHTPAGDLSWRRLFRWQIGIGKSWAYERGKPKPGKLGVAWWAWREMLRRTFRMIVRWRPWPTRSYYDALVQVAQYWGYLRAK